MHIYLFIYLQQRNCQKFNDVPEYWKHINSFMVQKNTLSLLIFCSVKQLQENKVSTYKQLSRCFFLFCFFVFL